MGLKVALFCSLLIQISVLQALADKSDKSPFGVEPQISGEEHLAVSRIAYQPVSGEEGTESDSGEAQAPAIRRLGKHHPDKSVAGGGVIIGGLVTAVFAAVFCYIRVTGKRDGGAGN